MAVDMKMPAELPITSAQKRTEHRTGEAKKNKKT